jgi:Na+/H+-dicarboxylate symporter
LIFTSSFLWPFQSRDRIVFQQYLVDSAGRSTFSTIIPSNPFYALSNNMSQLWFCLYFLGSRSSEQQRALDVFTVAKDALSRATKFVEFDPYGIFAIAAHTAGTLNPEQIARIQVYLITYVMVALLVALWVLPGLIAALTPFSYKEVLGPTRDALITAFMAADLFIVLPSLIQACKDLLERHRLVDDRTRSLPDVLVPTSFNFPHTGNLSTVLSCSPVGLPTRRCPRVPRLALTIRHSSAA